MLLHQLKVWFLPGFLGILFFIGLVLLYSELRNAVVLRRRKQSWPTRFPYSSDRRKAG
jgi:hypothetical protein